MAEIIAVVLLICALVAADIKRAIDQRVQWERDEHEQGDQ